jgi:hypothetical protein
MRISEAKKILSKTVEFNLSLSRRSSMINPMLWSLPGVGKTSIVEQVGEELNLPVTTVIVAQYDPVDLGGLPVLTEDRKLYRRAKPFFLDLPEDYRGIMFLDEITQAPLASQNILGQWFNEGRIGEHELPKGLILIGAGNPMGARAGTAPMPTQLKDRMLHLDIEADPTDFLQFALAENWRHEITGFIRHRPEFLHKFDSDVNACPSPRSWERVNTILQMGFEPQEQMKALDGQVGSGCSADFLGYLRVAKDMPDPEEVLNKPMETFIPEDPAVLYATCAALSSFVTTAKAANLLKYLDRIPNKEFSAFCVRDAIIRNDKLRLNKYVSDWFMKTGKELLL